MLHPRCDVATTCSCRRDERGNVCECSRRFPKDMCRETVIIPDGYPLYRRRGRFQATLSDGRIITDNWVVPHNPYLLRRYRAHCNIEVITRHTSHSTHRTSHITRHTTHITHHTSRITHHTSHVAHRTSHVTHHTSHITHQTSLITHHTSHTTHHKSHIARHTSHITHPTSRITHHISHITHHTSHITRHTLHRYALTFAASNTCINIRSSHPTTRLCALMKLTLIYRAVC
jgi:hypothetical protein